MSKIAIKRQEGRTRRKKAIRKRMSGTAQRPRLSVFRSSKHIYAQAVDDVNGVTVAAVSTLSEALKAGVQGLKPKAAAEVIGEAIAKQLTSKSIEQVVFDRNGFHYHGRVKALADGARKGGLKF
jgi:large subunit ribosomal protein L18